MLKRILGITSKDYVYTRRDYILVYMAIMPIVVALIFRIVLPFLETMDMTLAVDGSVPAEVVESLRDYASIEVLTDRAALETRVLQFDDVPGIYYDQGKYHVLLEGNEASYVKELPGSILDYLAGGTPAVDISFESRGITSTPIREVSAVLLAYMAVIIGGLNAGLNIVNERETKTMRALAVSPLSVWEYVSGKLVFTLLTGVVLTFASIFLLMGATGYSLPQLALTSVIGSLFGLLVGLCLGILANNQLTAIAVMKVLFLLVIGIPLGAEYLPQNLIWIAYAFPNYWVFEAFRQVFMAPELSVLLTNGVALIYSLLLLTTVPLLMRRTLKLH